MAKEQLYGCDEQDIIDFIENLPHSASADVPADINVDVDLVQHESSLLSIYKINGITIKILRKHHYQAKPPTKQAIVKALNDDLPSLFSFGDIHNISKFGSNTAFKLLYAAAPEQFVRYIIFKSIIYCLSPGSSNFSSLSVYLTGHVSNLTQSVCADFNSILMPVVAAHRNVQKVLSMEKYRNKALTYLQLNFESYKTIQEEWTVKYGGASENNLSYIFVINGKEIDIAKNNNAFTDPSTYEIYRLCIDLKSTVNSNGPLLDYVSKYGHNIVFSILEIIAYDETLKFFVNKANEIISSHELFYPRLLLKKYGFSSSRTNEIFLNNILDDLENFFENNKGRYISDNSTEYNKDDCWDIYYLKGESLAYAKLDYTKITNVKLRQEFIGFMREYAKHHKYHAISSTFGRISVILEKLPNNINSILEVTRADVVGIYSNANEYKTHTFYKILTNAGTLFNYINSLKDSAEKATSNPFYSIKHFDDTENITPPDIADIRKMLQNCSSVPNHIKIAFMMLLETGARANEISNLKTDDIEFDNKTGDAIIKKVLYKTIDTKDIPFVKIKISKELSTILKQFISDTANIREQLEHPFVFAYRNIRRRKNSSTPYKVLNPSILKNGVKKWASDVLGKEKAKSITPRSIRTLVGTELFKYGYTASEISDILGNTSSVAEKHYINLSPYDQSSIRHEFFEKNFTHIFDNNNNKVIDPIINTTLLGLCNFSKKCERGNDCSSCEHRISCSEKI